MQPNVISKILLSYVDTVLRRSSDYCCCCNIDLYLVVYVEKFYARRLKADFNSPISGAHAHNKNVYQGGQTNSLLALKAKIAAAIARVASGFCF